MVCLHCGAKTHVTNSRLQKRSNQVWRRRQCLNCNAIFTALEAVDYGSSWLVQSASGHLEPFLRDKLWLSLYKAVEHRPAAVKEAGALCDTIIKKLSPLAEEGRLGAVSIAQVAQVALNRFDQAASVYYQARHTA